MIVATVPGQTETQDICREAGVECLVSQDINRAGIVNRAVGINEALKTVPHGEWVIVTDADVVFTPALVDYIRNTELDGASIYAAQRLIAYEATDVEKYLMHGDADAALPEPRDACMYEQPGMPQGVQGFFQLFRYTGQRYPDTYEAAGNEDLEFTNNHWPVGTRHRLPFPVIHLGPAFQNWFGRRSAAFEIRPGLLSYLNRKTIMADQQDTSGNKEIIVKAELFDIIEKQLMLQADMQRLEQTKQAKLKTLAAIRGVK